MNVTIVGAGSHGQDVAAIATAAGHTVVGFLDDHKRGYAPTDEMSRAEAHLVGVNDPATRSRLASMHTPAPVAIHPTAQVEGSTIGEGSVIAAGAVVGPEVTLGWHVHVNQGATLVRATVGRFTTISPGVNICGDVMIGDRVLIGAGATICDRVTIGDGATIGAGAVVLPCQVVPAGATVVGVPGRVVV